MIIRRPATLELGDLSLMNSSPPDPDDDAVNDVPGIFGKHEIARDVLALFGIARRSIREQISNGALINVKATNVMREL